MNFLSGADDAAFFVYFIVLIIKSGIIKVILQELFKRDNITFLLTDIDCFISRWYY